MEYHKPPLHSSQELSFVELRKIFSQHWSFHRLTSTTMSSVTVLYPAASDAQFDMDYYMKTHMPLVMENWKGYGLESWT